MPAGVLPFGEKINFQGMKTALGNFINKMTNETLQSAQVQEPTRKKGPSFQPMGPGGDAEYGESPMEESDINWNKIFSRSHATKGNAEKLIQRYGSEGKQVLDVLGVPEEWYTNETIASETKWPNTNEAGWTDQQGRQHTKAEQRELFNRGIRQIIENRGLDYAMHILGPRTGLGIPFAGSYFEQGKRSRKKPSFWGGSHQKNFFEQLGDRVLGRGNNPYF